MTGIALSTGLSSEILLRESHDIKPNGGRRMEENIRTKLEDLRGMLQADGGDLEVVEIDGANVKLRLKGACGGCPHAAVTLKDGIERILRQEIDEAITVEHV